MNKASVTRQHLQPNIRMSQTTKNMSTACNLQMALARQVKFQKTKVPLLHVTQYYQFLSAITLQQCQLRHDGHNHHITNFENPNSSVMFYLLRF